MAELKMAMARSGKVDSAMADLAVAMPISPDNMKAFFLLGECYEVKNMEARASKAYGYALRIEYKLAMARQALDHLNS